MRIMIMLLGQIRRHIFDTTDDLLQAFRQGARFLRRGLNGQRIGGTNRHFRTLLQISRFIQPHNTVTDMSLVNHGRTLHGSFWRNQFARSNRYSITMITSPGRTGRSFSTITSFTLPLMCARISLNIFMFSSSAKTVSSSKTSSPVFT